MEKNDQINQDEVKSVARAALDYIDALPKDVVAALPAMPGFDRDWAESVLADVNPNLHPDVKTGLDIIADTIGANVRERLELYADAPRDNLPAFMSNEGHLFELHGGAYDHCYYSERLANGTLEQLIEAYRAEQALTDDLDATCAEDRELADKLLTPHEVEILNLYRDFPPEERSNMLRIFQLRKGELDSFAAHFADVPRDVLEKVISTDNCFNVDMSDVLKGIGIDLKDEKLRQLSDSMINTVKELANYLISDGWTPHEITFDGRYRFSKQVGGEMQYRDIISRVEGNGSTLRANVWEEVVQVEGKNR